MVKSDKNDKAKPKRQNKWIRALKEWNGQQMVEGKVGRKNIWCIPKKGSPQYNDVRKIMEKLK